MKQLKPVPAKTINQFENRGLHFEVIYGYVNQNGTGSFVLISNN